MLCRFFPHAPERKTTCRQNERQFLTYRNTKNPLGALLEVHGMLDHVHVHRDAVRELVQGGEEVGERHFFFGFFFATSFIRICQLRDSSALNAEKSGSCANRCILDPPFRAGNNTCCLRAKNDLCVSGSRLLDHDFGVIEMFVVYREWFLVKRRFLGRSFTHADISNSR